MGCTALSGCIHICNWSNYFHYNARNGSCNHPHNRHNWENRRCDWTITPFCITKKYRKLCPRLLENRFCFPSNVVFLVNKILLSMLEDERTAELSILLVTMTQKKIATWRSRSSQIAGSSMLCEQHNSCCYATVQHLMTSFCNIWWHHLYDLHILDFDDTKLVGSS